MFLKKFITFWLMPFPLCLTLLVAGWWLTRGRRNSQAGRALIGAAVLLLLLFGNKAVSNALVRPLETMYPPVPEFAPGSPPAGLAACRYLAVLGGGNSNRPELPATARLSAAAISRVAEAVRLLRALPGARLILSGPGDGRFASHAEVMAEAAVSLGIGRDRIILVDYAHDTEEEAQAVRALVGSAPVGLVTSAWHMPRAMTFFRRAGVDALPCPTDYAWRTTPGFHLGEMDWDVESLGRSTAAVHERLGLLWLHLKSRH